MKNVLLRSSMALILSTPVMAASPVQGWYLGLMGIGSNVSALKLISVDPVFNPGTATFKYRFGGGIGLALGYRFNQFRGEAEPFFITNAINSILINGYDLTKTSDIYGFSMKGKTTEKGLFLNAFYDIFAPDDDTNFIPYIGAGIGYANVKNQTDLYLNNVRVDGANISFSNSNPMGQLILGANYHLDDYTNFGLDYRYMSSLKINKKTIDNTNFNSNQKFTANTLNLSFNYSFDTSA